MDELDYLSNAANPADLSESNIRITTKNNGQEIEYRLQKSNSSVWSNFSQNATKMFDNQTTLIPYKILALNSSNNDVSITNSF
jgi:hypothetical protein